MSATHDLNAVREVVATLDAAGRTRPLTAGESRALDALTIRERLILRRIAFNARRVGAQQRWQSANLPVGVAA